MNITDEELIRELSTRFTQSRKAFSDLSVVNRKLLEMNKRLEASESLKSNFLSNIRNELNNPLNAIMGLTSQLAAIVGKNAEIDELAAMVYAEVASLDFQLRNIFMAADLEAGEASPHGTRIHLSAALKEVVDSFQHISGKKNVQLIHASGAGHEEGVVSTDSVFLQIITSNLLANAIEYSHTGGVVNVSSSINGDGSLQLAVHNQGIGIEPEDQQRIFDRFTQLVSGATRSHLGHGLGLSVTKALVDLMQGSISLKSASGEGTLFTVVLPPCNLSADDTTFAESGNLFIFDEISEAQAQ